MIHRVDVRTKGEVDPVGEMVRHQIAQFGADVGPITSYRIFLIDSPAENAQIRRAARELLADPIVEESRSAPSGKSNRIEIHLKPGVMDPVATSTEMAIRDLGIDVKEVRTGRAYVMDHAIDRAELERIAFRALANGVIESVHFEPFVPEQFATGQPYNFNLRTVEIRKLNDEQLKKLSREGHLFLSLAEMKAIQAYFRERGREPTDIELETLAQTWSEHCVHKTLKSAVEVVDEKGNVLRRYSNLIKDTIFAATQQLIEREPGFCLSVFKDNAGVISFDETDAVCFKVETHNHPSAIEPYGGSATGVGGVIRDILGTGLAAKPIANTDVFCVADPNTPIDQLPRGVIHPKRVLQQVVAGVRDYGNRMGIPTVNGAVYFDRNYIGNPLVFCGCVGLIPRNKIEKESQKGDAIVVIGGRTGRDGIHGATFSSAELTDTHADEFSHAVQIGNAITEKKVADVILEARDRGLFNAITDCGAGGLSSAVGEMGQQIGAFVELDKVPLKYAGLRYDEIWISEAQERMVLAVPPDKVNQLLVLCKSENVEGTVIGYFGTNHHELVLNYQGNEVGRMTMRFVHDGIPMPTRKAFVPAPRAEKSNPDDSAGSVRDRLLSLLASPNIASKHWIIRQYDHEVQGGSVVKPLTGPIQIGPSDAAVIRPKHNSNKAVVLSNGMSPQIDDPYAMTVAAIDEAIRNAVCVGADPSKLAILDNFCWPSVEDETTMGTLVAACEACRAAALAYGVPFISGKDSLHNQFTNQETKEVIRIPRTLLISAIGVINDARKCVTMDLKDSAEGRLFMISPKSISLPALAAVHRAVADAISRSWILSCHDISDGGSLVAAAEMCIASGMGLNIQCDDPFGESNARYLVEIHSQRISDIEKLMSLRGVALKPLGQVTHDATLIAGENCQVKVDELTTAWRGTLDW